jgi:hypothetical protein
MNIVGVVAFANSIIFRRPRQVIEEFFGMSPPTLKNIKDHVLRKVHTYFGLGFLLTGFLFQIAAVLPVTQQSDKPGATLPFLLVGVVAVAALLEIVGTRYSKRSFRKHLRKFFRANPHFSFERNPEVTKEIGEIFEVGSTPDETVEGYVRRLRTKIGVDGDPGRGAIRA